MMTRSPAMATRRDQKTQVIPFGFLLNRGNDSKVNLIQQCPQIPVGGRLRFFLENWKKITDDQWVLSLIEEGYKLEFIQIPPQSGMKETIVPRKNLDILNAEVAELLRKDAIEKVPPNERGCGFYSTFFLVPKKNGKMRPVINLRPLNRYLKKEHFKMDTLKKVINLVKPNDWAISLDLSDAYLHIPIFQKHRKYLRFCIAGQCWQWKCLCFGPSTAPRVFSKVISVIAAHLRAQNIRLASYLDDWLALNQLKRLLVQDREKCLNLLVALGFIINKEKSELIPKQEIVYIGGAFHLKLGIVTPTPERLRKLDLAIQRLLSGQNQARDFLHLLGLMASCLELIPNGRLFMRPIQLHLLAFWRPASMDLEVVVPITQHLKSHLRWWSDPANTVKGRSLQQAHTQITIATDASKLGYGGHVGKDFIQGTWSKSQSELHINLLELEAVFLTVKHFLPVLKNKNVLIRSDSTTVCQYVNRQGGTKSPPLCYRTWDLWNFALENNMHLKAAHILGARNILADQLSRVRVRSTEWQMHKVVVQTLFQIWGTPLIDLFASKENKQTPVFCSWIPYQDALAIDALSISWEGMFAYVYPPICLIPKVLQHMEQFRCQIILIAPKWPRRHWYPDLLKFLIACPRKLPLWPDLLQQPKTMISHPNPEVFSLHAWLLSTEVSKRRAFLTSLESSFQPFGGQVLNGTTLVNSINSVAGVVQDKLIPIVPL